ncbi:MAG: helix-turn-helix domain-containing protein [Polyangia bacterium]
MDDLEIAVAHIRNTIEHVPPLAQQALQDALSHIERARSLSSSGDLSALTALSPIELGTLLRIRREACGLSQKKLSERSGLSDRTIKNLEQGEQTPTLETLRRLAGVAELELHQSSIRTTSGQPRTLPNSWILPRYDRRALMAELKARANQNGAALEQTMLYLDDQSAQDYLDLCGSDSFVERFRSLPLEAVAEAIIERAGDRPLDLNALGPGDGRTEVSLALELLNRTSANLRLHLLDISHPLLVIAYQRAAEKLGDRAEVMTLHGDFHHIWRYPVFLPSPGQTQSRRRIYTMLGVTMANLDNEVSFVRDQLGLAAEGDFCVLDYQKVFAPPSEPEKIRELDPPLARGASAHSSWITGPLRRYCSDVAKLETEAQLNTRSLVEGSYEIDFFVTVFPHLGPPHKHLAVKTRRYCGDKLRALFSDYGWNVLHDLPYGPSQMSSVLVMEKKAKR